jgi:hypothetical protein
MYKNVALPHTFLNISLTIYSYLHGLIQNIQNNPEPSVAMQLMQLTVVMTFLNTLRSRGNALAIVGHTLILNSLQTGSYELWFEVNKYRPKNKQECNFFFSPTFTVIHNFMSFPASTFIFVLLCVKTYFNIKVTDGQKE